MGKNFSMLLIPFPFSCLLVFFLCNSSKPDSVNKKVHFSPHIQTDPRQNYFQAKSRLQPSGIRSLSRQGVFYF